MRMGMLRGRFGRVWITAVSTDVPVSSATARDSEMIRNTPGWEEDHWTAEQSACRVRSPAESTQTAINGIVSSSNAPDAPDPQAIATGG
jgi:hypothetical protein